MPSKKKNPTRAIKMEANEADLPSAGRSWFLGIGINDYQHFRSLNNARKDVEEVLTLLRERYELDEFRTLFDEQATRDRIIDGLQELQERLQEEDKLIIYYSGHGYLDQSGRGYWLPHEAEKRRVATYLRNSAIREFVEDIRARHILLISDSCFSGTLLTRNVEMHLAALSELERDRSRWVIASGRQQEAVADGKPGANSPFTTSVLKVLAKNQDAGLNAALLFDQVSKLTRYQYDQMPQSAPLIGAGHEGGQYIFRLRKDKGELEAYGSATKLDTIAAYSAFLRAYPRGTYAEKALTRIVELEDEQAWQKAQKEDRLSAYFYYLKQHPEGKYVEVAHAAIEKLEQAAGKPPIAGPEPAAEPAEVPAEDKLVWEKIKDGKDLKALRAFQKKFPDSIYFSPVRALINRYEKAQAKALKEKQEEPRWKEATELETLSAFEGYLKDYPSGKYATEAASRASRLKENLIWQQAVEQETPAAYQAYLDQYRYGRYVAEAVKRRDRLKEKDIFVDPRDGQIYRLVKLNGLLWMAENLNFATDKGSWWYENDPKNGNYYGRLYNWEAAVTACPPGWRLPSDEEWKDLLLHLGGYYEKRAYNQTGDDARMAYQALTGDGSSNFGAQLGGSYAKGKFQALEKYGFYWSGTPRAGDLVWAYEFYKRGSRVERGDFRKFLGFSCRCVRDL